MRVVIAEDLTLLRDGLTRLLEAFGFEVVEAVDNGPALLPALLHHRPDVAIVHAQRATSDGDTQIWGLLGCQKEAAFAAERVIVVCEEVVDEAVVRQDPNRTVIPGVIVDAVVEEPFACHPSYAQGYYDRDNGFYRRWDAISHDRDGFQRWMAENVLAAAVA